MKTREEKIQEYLKEPYKVGDKIYVRGLGLQDKSQWGRTTHITKIDGNDVYFKEYRSEGKTTFDNIKKYTGHLGEDPFNDELSRKVENINFDLSSIIFSLDLDGNKSEYITDSGHKVRGCNFNPFVIIDGVKKYYQRPLVWELEDKQALIHSIYNGISCGKIIVRRRDFNWVMKSQRTVEEACWVDVVDGKQRLNAIVDFINNEFPDKYGNYWRDLSDLAKHKFTNHQLFSYGEMSEDTTDEDVLKQFLSINFTGKPQSVDHINYVESLLKKS